MIELRPCSAVKMFIFMLFVSCPPAQSRMQETRLDVQNYRCNGNLLCDHGVLERNRISSLLLGKHELAHVNMTS